LTLPCFRLPRRQCAVAGLSGRPGSEILRFPLPAPARLAVVDVQFLPAGNLRHFAAGDVRDLVDYAPEALVLPLSSALSMADRKLRGLFDLPSLRVGIVVLSSLDSSDGGPLGTCHRDLLWKAFGLPVFEQLRGWDGRVIARECEVHDGLHFEGDAAHAGRILADLPAEIAVAQCECGSETPRLRHVAAPLVSAAAA